MTFFRIMAAKINEIFNMYRYLHVFSIQLPGYSIEKRNKSNIIQLIKLIDSYMRRRSGVALFPVNGRIEQGGR